MEWSSSTRLTANIPDAHKSKLKIWSNSDQIFFLFLVKVFTNSFVKVMIKTIKLQGRVQFPTGGKPREPILGRTGGIPVATVKSG